MTTWDKHIAEIENRVATEGYNNFIRWPTIQATMFVGDNDYITRELNFVQGFFPDWRDIIKDAMVGNPIPSKLHKGTTGSYIHAAYHWARCLEQLGMSDLSGFDSIVEFGGGYGAMATLVQRLGFSGEYKLFDFPIMQRLQAYYLIKNEVFNVEFITSTPPFAKASLFVSMNAITEAPMDTRKGWLNSTEYAFINFADNWEGVNNYKWAVDNGFAMTDGSLTGLYYGYRNTNNPQGDK